MLYHKNVFWKKSFDIESAELVKSANRFSRHLQEYFNSKSERRNFDAKDIMRIVDKLKTFDSIKAFEVETDGHTLQKVNMKKDKIYIDIHIK